MTPSPLCNDRKAIGPIPCLAAYAADRFAIAQTGDGAKEGMG